MTVLIDSAGRRLRPAGRPQHRERTTGILGNAWKQPISVSARCASTPLAKTTARLSSLPVSFALGDIRTDSHNAQTWDINSDVRGVPEVVVCVGAGEAQGGAARSRVASVSRSLAASLARRRSSGGRWAPSWVAGSLVSRISTSRPTRPIDSHPSRVSDCGSVSILDCEQPQIVKGKWDVVCFLKVVMTY